MLEEIEVNNQCWNQHELW